MKKFLKWTSRVLIVIAGLSVSLALAIWIADPAVLRNMAFGPRMGDVVELERMQPQEAVPGVARADLPQAPADTIAPEGLATAERYAARTNSVALLVWHRGALRYEKYWPGFGPDTRTNPNSGHKTVLGLLVGLAIEDGYIKSVDERASNWITEWRNDARKDITVKDLLQMSSGLEIPKFGRWTSTRITLGSDLSASVLGLQVDTPHGSEFQYSNANAQLLTLLVERASGKRYAQYLSERLWSRLGTGTAAVWLDREGGMPRGFCCLFASARDWLRVGLLFLDRGRAGGEQIVSEQWINDMTTPAKTNPNYGYQVWLGSPPGRERTYNKFSPAKAFHSEPFAARDMIYVDGFGGQRVYVVPSLELVIVRTGEAKTDWDDAIVPNAIIRALRSAGGAQ